MLTRAKSAHPLFVLAGLMAASFAGLALLPKIPQDQAYHLFADQRALVGIPNFWNFVSNIPFAVVGAVGSVVDLQAAIHAYLAEHNANPKPFVWTKSAEAILAKLDRCPVPSVWVSATSDR